MRQSSKILNQSYFPYMRNLKLKKITYIINLKFKIDYKLYDKIGLLGNLLNQLIKWIFHEFQTKQQKTSLLRNSDIFFK